jgi:hypothetical protein
MIIREQATMKRGKLRDWWNVKILVDITAVRGKVVARCCYL